MATIAVSLIGPLYAAAARGERSAEPSESIGAHEVVLPEPILRAPEPAIVAVEPEPVASEPADPVPVGIDAPEDVAALLDPPEVLIDEDTGVRVGPLKWNTEPESDAESEAESAPAAARTARRARPASPPPTRLHPDPGWNVILTARQMNARGERIQGSCYHYLSEVFSRAGHDGWRSRRVVYNGHRNGPYANLDLIRPGDWLYIVNHPESTPVGTHSVLFVGWQDRASGYANVIEHSGWGAAMTGQERGYDVSRTYRITRPIRSE
ncbi:MAG: hypothetical protein AB7S26_33295 [Sandaracinaceae bacterium]